MPCSSECADDKDSEEATARENASKLSEAMQVLRTLPALTGGEERCFWTCSTKGLESR
jgi:hypothetical protein